MALAFEEIDRTRTSQRWLVTYEVTMDTDYPDGGWEVAANDLGLGTLKRVIGCSVEVEGFVAYFDHANSKIVVQNGDGSGAAALEEASVGEDGLADGVLTLTAIGI